MDNCGTPRISCFPVTGMTKGPYLKLFGADQSEAQRLDLDLDSTTVSGFDSFLESSFPVASWRKLERKGKY